MADYINATAGLLESNTKASTANQDRIAQRGMKTQELLQSSSNAALEQQGAMDRMLEGNKKAQLLQNLREQADMALQTMSQQEESKRQEKLLKQQAEQHHQQNYFTMTPNTVSGIKSSLGLDFKDLEGQEVNKDLILALIAAKYKTDIADAYSSARKDGSGKSTKDLQDELTKIENSAKANRDKLFTMSTKDLPPEVWGGEPGNFRKLAQTISKGNFGKLDAQTQSQIALAAGYINTIKSQQERANLIHKQLGTSPVDYSGFGLADNASPTGGAAETGGSGTGVNDKTIQVRTSDGNVHVIYESKLEAARQRDPKLKVIGQ